MSIILNRRIQQSGQLSDVQIDANWTTIQTAIDALQAGTSLGTVTSVGLSMPAVFSVAGSPVTSAGTITVSLATQTANLVFSSATSGGAATPAFRALVAADLPIVTIAKGGTNSSAALSNSRVMISVGGAVIEGDTATYPTITELSYVKGVTSPLQTQINAKEGTISILTNAKGGTGLNTNGAVNGRILIGNGTGFTLANLTAGANITITNGAGAITIASTGGITTLNGLTATPQVFSIGATDSSAFSITSATATHTFLINTATAAVGGLLSTGVQTIGGVKTFAANPIFQTLAATSTIPYITTGREIAQDTTNLLWNTSTLTFSTSNITSTGILIQTKVRTIDANETLAATDFMVLVDIAAAGGTIDLVLPNVGTATYQRIYIKALTTFGGATLRISPFGGQNIDGSGATIEIATGVQGWVEVYNYSNAAWILVDSKLS